MPIPERPDLRNVILASLSAGDFGMLRGSLERINMVSGGALQGAVEPAKCVYFVDSGVVSLLAPLEHGGRIEIGQVGREGVAGVHAALGAETLTLEIMAQSDGVVLRAEAAVVRALMEQSGRLRQLLNWLRQRAVRASGAGRRMQWCA